MKPSLFCLVLLLLVGCQSPGETQSRPSPVDPARNVASHLIAEMEQIAGDPEIQGARTERVRSLSNRVVELRDELHELTQSVPGSLTPRQAARQSSALAAELRDTLDELAGQYRTMADALEMHARQYEVAHRHGLEWVDSHPEANEYVLAAISRLCSTYGLQAESYRGMSVVLSAMAEGFQRQHDEVQDILNRLNAG